jgi:hypothetical protein
MIVSMVTRLVEETSRNEAGAMKIMVFRLGFGLKPRHQPAPSSICNSVAKKGVERKGTLHERSGNRTIANGAFAATVSPRAAARIGSDKKTPHG